MIKKLLSSVAILTAFASFAQNKSIKESGVYSHYTLNNEVTANAKATAVNCDTLRNFPLYAPTTTLTIYTVPTSTSCAGGYVVGNNCYGDLAKANFFANASYSALASPSVTGCFVFFYKKAGLNIGTHGVPTNSVGLKFYNGTMAGGPTTQFGTTTNAPFASIATVFSPTSNIGSFQYTFAPIALPVGGFFSSITLPTASGDTAVIYQQYQASTTSGWEFDGTTWFDMKANWGATINFELCLFPVLKCSPLGIKANELEHFFTLVPNPSNGVFSLVSTLSTINFDLTVTNAIGQQIISKKNVSGASVNEINLTDNNSGLYFVTITSGNNTITKKIILNK